MTGIACDNTKKCIVYNLRIPSLSRFDFTEEQIKQMQEQMQKLGVELVKNAVSNSSLLRRCVEDNYSFRYDIYDKGDNFLYDIFVKYTEIKGAI